MQNTAAQYLRDMKKVRGETDAGEEKREGPCLGESSALVRENMLLMKTVTAAAANTD